MVARMKTTIDVADAVLAEAKALAGRRGTTLRSVVEDALRREIRRAASEQSFVLRDASYGTGGLTPAAEAAGGWGAVHELAYDDGRGLRP